jgi:hypothetical protein
MGKRRSKMCMCASHASSGAAVAGLVVPLLWGTTH